MSAEADGVDSGETAVQQRVAARVQRRTIAGGVALGFLAAGIVGGVLLGVDGDEGGGGSERIAEVDATTTTTEAGDPAGTADAAVATTVPAASAGAGAPADPAGSGGGDAPAVSADPVPIEAVIADHEERITDLEQTPAAPAPAPAPAPVVPRDPPPLVTPPTTVCEQWQWDVTGDCDDSNNPPTEP